MLKVYVRSGPKFYDRGCPGTAGILAPSTLDNPIPMNPALMEHKKVYRHINYSPKEPMKFLDLRHQCFITNGCPSTL